MYNDKRPIIAISSCLLGNPVRYNKGHTQDKWLVRELSKFVDFHPICPEMAMGLGAPREEIHLVKTNNGHLQLRSKKSKNDLTDLAHSTYTSMIDELKANNIDGFILMKKSPSCAVGNAKVVSENNPQNVSRSSGLFTQTIEEVFPDIPKIDSGRLQNTELRENFIKIVYAHFRFRKLNQSLSEIQNYHSRYKYTLMDHSQESLRNLGRILANHEGKDILNIFSEYKKLFFKTLSIQSTVKNKINTLQHILGYLSKFLTKQEKSDILSHFSDYKYSIKSYLVPSSILFYLIRKYQISYLENQYLFTPYPKDLRINITGN